MESDGEDEVAHNAGETAYQGAPSHEDQWDDEHAASDGLQDGMLLRDVPKRTTFYDPVAERQMSQTDAKLFYQRSKAENRHATNSGTWPLGTPHGSPMIASGSRSGTEYGADSLVLDPEGPVPPSLGQPESTPGVNSPPRGGKLSAFPSMTHLASSLHAQNGNYAQAASNPPLNPPVGMLNSSLFDAEPHITSELSAIAKNIQHIVDLRRKYISLSSQGPEDNPRDQPGWEIYPPPPEPAWKQDEFGEADPFGSKPGTSDTQTGNGSKRSGRRRKPGQNIGEDFDMDDLLPLPGDDGMVFTLDEGGVYQVFQRPDATEPAVRVPTIREFYIDLDDILNTSSDGPSKSFAFRRLQYLEGKFNLYVLLNEYQETADSKKVPHRDFYNVRKVDTHVHHSACMNQKHLLRFIKSKMKKFPNEVVLFRDGKHLTLAEVFASINLTAYDLSIDTLDMHVSSQLYHLRSGFVSRLITP